LREPAAQGGVRLMAALAVGDGANELDMVRAAGSDVMPRLKPGGPVRWIGTRGQLTKTARALGIHGQNLFVDRAAQVVVLGLVRWAASFDQRREHLPLRVRQNLCPVLVNHPPQMGKSSRTDRP